MTVPTNHSKKPPARAALLESLSPRWQMSCGTVSRMLSGYTAEHVLEGEQQARMSLQAVAAWNALPEPDRRRPFGRLTGLS